MSTRQMSGGAGLLFKGSGFYLTDYGKNAHRGSAPEKKGDAGAKTSESKPDAKPDAKAETKTEQKAPKTESKSSESSAKPKPKPKSE
jgi:hypothetical protein